MAKAGFLFRVLIRGIMNFMPVKKVLKFPDGFLWGAATSAYQVEGGIDNCDWAQNERVPRAGRACEHYCFYDRDFALAHSLGQNAHRLSIEWSRLEPQVGQFNYQELKHYQQVLSALRARQLEPFVTLWHFTLPQWLAMEGGWQNSRSIDYFCRYVEFVVGNLKGRVKFWLTLNEPEVYLLNGYLKSKWPPFKKSLFNAWQVRKNLIKAHKLAYLIIKKIQPSAQVGLPINFSWFSPRNRYSPIDWLMARLALWVNGIFLRPNKKFIDFLGVNYYTRRLVGIGRRVLDPRILPSLRASARHGKSEDDTTGKSEDDTKRKPEDDNVEKTDMGWKIYPKGIYQILRRLKKYHLPVYITENGLADKSDQRRWPYIRDHLMWLHQAIERSVDVRGYFYWSLMDNFEWADGFDPCFGLIEINYRTMERCIRPSAWQYAKVCQSNQFVVSSL